MAKRLLTLLLSFNFLLFPKLTFAHSFGKLYNLPVPFWMYLYGGAAAILVSFLIIGILFNKTSANLKYKTYSLPGLKFFTSDIFISMLRVISLLLFLLTILAGLIGVNSSYSNFNMTFFWIIFVLGLTYLTAFVGNVYAKINPLRVVVEFFEKLINQKSKGVIKYPESLGYFPALIFYFLFICIELFGRTTPQSLSVILIQYTLLNFILVMLVGKDAWLKYCELFSVFFRLVSRLAPIENTGNNTKTILSLRAPFFGFLKEKTESFSLLLFILFMLSSTAYDGFRETIPWYRFYYQNLKNILDFEVFQVLGLIISPLLFLAIYLIFISLTKLITKTKESVRQLSLQFAFSLIPIAFVYNFSHYYTLLLTEGQNFIRIISDPFGFGWNLFNTAGYVPNLAVIDAGVTWHVQVGVILLGHIISVYIAHLIALQIFPTHKKALFSQIPMLFLMVAFTIIGLWIMAQPVTGGTL